MKILMISRATLHSAPGGDTIQILETAQSLRKAGIMVDIKLTNEIIDYTGYDIIHFFNITRPSDFLRHIRQSKLPYVVSTIYVDYSEIESRNRKGLLGLLGKVLSIDRLEYLKTIARWILNGESVGDMGYLFLGHRYSIKKVIRKASMLLPNSESEYNRLQKRYRLSGKYMVVPNGINTEKFNSDDLKVHDARRSNVLCVGRLENTKNQLTLIKALNGQEFRLVLIGKPSPNQAAYYEECRRIAASNVIFVDHMSQEELIGHYKEAKVHVLPSWFETTGLSSLEAAVMGCNIVVTPKGDTVEYFRDQAHYCDPADERSILDAITKAYHHPYNPALRERILREYTWENAARQTLNAYNEVLKGVSNNI